MQSTIENITYADLVDWFGNDNAQVLVRTVEREAKVSKSNVIQFDYEKRLRCAFEAMRDNDLAA